MTEPFGANRPSPMQEWFRSIGARLPSNYFGRRAASLLLGPAGGRAQRAYDVAVFGAQKARLHPYDNICEKRVYLTPQLWDGAERKFLGDVISSFSERTFYFVDIGANAGLYTLFARSEAVRAGAAFKALCIEPDQEMLARIKFNISASGAEDDVTVAGCAASDQEGELLFAVNRRSRGLSRIDDAGDIRVPARPILSIIRDAGFERIDAMKIDIEGHEHKALGAFFRDAPAALHPKLIILETSHAAEGNSAEELARRAGYSTRLQTVRNAVLVKRDQTPG